MLNDTNAIDLIKQEMLPQVALFGRANVGKSSLFNKLVGKNRALVSNISGTTRDCNAGIVDWCGLEFCLIDTGGIINLSTLFQRKNIPNKIEAHVQKQVRDVLKKADLILFVVDARVGLQAEDKQAILLLKKIFRKMNHVKLVVNKVDNAKEANSSADFYKLSLGELNLVSANTGRGTGDLLDVVNAELAILKPEWSKGVAGLAGVELGEAVEEDDNSEDEIELGGVPVEDDHDDEDNEDNEDDEDDEDDEENESPLSNVVNVALLGKPNVGKSSLVNVLLGSQKMIVSSEAHTTRESKDSFIEHENFIYRLIDTAGIVRRQHRQVKQNNRGLMNQDRLRVESDLNALSIADSLSTIRDADIVLFMIDVTHDITGEDAKILQEIVDRKKSVIILANKWDKVEDRDVKKYTDYIYGKFPYITWAPIHYMSAKTGLKADKLLDLILQIYKERNIKISKSVLNKFLVKVVKIHKPAKSKGVKPPRIYELSQSASSPPEFKIRIGTKDTLHFSYVKFIENRIRDKYGFLGTPIITWVKKGR
ncbi:ribosome biogenesis GTPase Der [Patescibacteria group bacterium]|nr:ribosome biogenesis GTPase Der [Patescibacteria group bacterium]